MSMSDENRQIAARCRGLNFLAIATLLEGYGYNDPDGTIRKLKELGNLTLAWKKQHKPTTSFEEIIARLDKIPWASSQKFRHGIIKTEVVRRIIGGLTEADCEIIGQMAAKAGQRGTLP